MFTSAAQKYISCGLSVFPATSTKKPAIPSWTPYQTRLPSTEELESWAKDLDNMNVAIVCGKLSDLTVVDCDTPEAIQKVEELLPDLLEVPIVETPRGGRHYYFRFCPELHSRNGAADGIDVKSEGGYVLAPPSRTKDGPYLWPKNLKAGLLRERPFFPDALRAFLAATITQATPALPNKPILAQGTRDNDLFHAALHLFRDGRPRDEVERIVLDMAKICTPPFPEKEARAKVKSAYDRLSKRESAAEVEIKLVERNSALVKTRPIPWLWPGVIPTHMATAITGDAGQGKSLVAIDLAARVSQGKVFPAYGSTSPPVKGHVFYITSEGVPEMILVPRLIAAGANLGKIEIIEGVCIGSGDFQMFDITQHLLQVERRAKDFPDLRLIIVDPIASFLPERINPNQANSVRQAMDKVSTLAYKLGVAALTIMHFNKPSGTGGKAIHRTSGSVQFEASVKMSWSVVRREGDPINARLLVPQKSTITGSYKSFAFSIQEVQFPVPDDPTKTITTAKIEYGALVDDDPETLISPPVEGPDNHVALACKFLRRKLSEGKTLYAVPLIDEAEDQGIPKWALYKAKDRMGIQHDKEGTFQGRTFWYMPQEKSICP
jgi:putative DNA primase/helicase